MTSVATRGVRRPDGPAKLSGSAVYAADAAPTDAVAAALVTSTIPSGRLAELDTEAARQAPGVVAVLTHDDMPRFHALSSPPLGHSAVVMQDEAIHYDGQPLALVVAETWEQAHHAASLVAASYTDVSPGVAFGHADEALPDGGHVLVPVDESKGDVDAALTDAEAVVSATYTTADRHHNPIEPAASVAWWDGDQLTLHSSVQGVSVVQQVLAAMFGIQPENVRVVSPFIGGGFGCKGYIWPYTYLAAAAARVIDRPVRLVLTRAQMFSGCGHQPATRQTVSLGATGDGRLTGIRHHSVNATSRLDDYIECATAATAWMYASPAIETRLRVERLDRSAPTPMRAPHEGPGMVGLEMAMDELAHELEIDPVELRLRNEPDVDPMTGKPFSTRPLTDCLHEGARRFGWSDRTPGPRSMRSGDELIGWGMAVATMDTFRSASSARVRIDADGHVTVEAGTQEIGTGLPAMMQTVAADALGRDPESIEIRHGDTSLPPAGMTAGSTSTMGLGSAVHAAATELREKLDAVGGQAGIRRSGLESLEVEGRWEPGADTDGVGRTSDHSIHTYGAIFVEVRVDEDLGLVRMPRCVGVYGAGRIINPLAARSQMIGGIVWGYGQALLEQSTFEPDVGRFLSKNLAGYLVPVNADIGDIDVAFVDDDDRLASPLGAKGIGELSAVGTGPAIANAVFHATGKRIRHLPIRLHDLL